jgi:hypothetical protein
MRWPVLLALAAIGSTAATGAETAAPTGPSAAQIIGKNVAARGGLDAWRKIQRMVWIGHIKSAHVTAPSMPFILELKRPNRTRFEIQVQNTISARIFDGTQGWKVHSGRDGRPEVQPYTADELRFAREGQAIGEPLVDYQAKGISIALEGTDEVEGHEAYRLKVTLPSGTSHHVWIDTQSFLDIKNDRKSNNEFGQSGTVSIFYRDYRAVDGLKLPFVIESGARSGKATDKMVIDKILLNPPLDDALFAKPTLPVHHMGTADSNRPYSVRPNQPRSQALAYPAVRDPEGARP